MTPTEAFFWSERLIGVAVFLQSVELLQGRRVFADSGVWSWSVLRQDYPRWAAVLLTPVMSARGFFILLVIRSAFAASLVGNPEMGFGNILLGFVTLSSILVCWRWRGTYNGGSDFMTMVVLLALSFASVWPHWMSFALGYIAVQLGFSYFLPGLIKLKKREWRSGKALTIFMKTPNYEVPEAIRKVMASSRLAWMASWGLILFECCFPVVLVSARFCEVYLAVALIFHLATFYVFGLNRFVWAWLAAFPALLYWRH